MVLHYKSDTFSRLSLFKVSFHGLFSSSPLSLSFLGLFPWSPVQVSVYVSATGGCGRMVQHLGNHTFPRLSLSKVSFQGLFLRPLFKASFLGFNCMGVWTNIAALWKQHVLEIVSFRGLFSKSLFLLRFGSSTCLRQFFLQVSFLGLFSRSLYVSRLQKGLDEYDCALEATRARGSLFLRSLFYVSFLGLFSRSLFQVSVHVSLTGWCGCILLRFSLRQSPFKVSFLGLFSRSLFQVSFLGLFYRSPFQVSFLGLCTCLAHRAV